jgi:rubrerythrin
MKEMISKEDALEYFDQMYALEKKMEKQYSELSKKVSDSELKRNFLRLQKEEQEHGKKVQELKNLLDVYWPD